MRMLDVLNLNWRQFNIVNAPNYFLIKILLSGIDNYLIRKNNS